MEQTFKVLGHLRSYFFERMEILIPANRCDDAIPPTISK